MKVKAAGFPAAFRRRHHGSRPVVAAVVVHRDQAEGVSAWQHGSAGPDPATRAPRPSCGDPGGRLWLVTLLVTGGAGVCQSATPCLAQAPALGPGRPMIGKER